MGKIKKWIASRAKRPDANYDEAKREFEMAMGNPFICIKVELPSGFEDSRAQFLNLESDEDFLMEVKDLIKKTLEYKKHGLKGTP